MQRAAFGLLGLLLIPALAGLPALSGEAVKPPAAPAPSAGEPPSEEHLFRELCRYLRLSRRQAGLLLPTARYIERARELFAREEAEAERRLEMLRDRPEEAQQIIRDLEARRERIAGDLVQFSAPQLVRVLTREQIALVWRLIQGRPPAYARAHPDLLLSDAGFSQRPRGGVLQLGGAEFELLTEELIASYFSLQNAEATRLRRDEAQSGIPGAAGRPVQPLLQAPERPFPQLVIETDNLADLVPHVVPLVRRVFLSEEWLPTLVEVWRQGLPIRPSKDHRLVSRRPTRVVRDYRMERGLRDLTGKGPELEPLGGTLDHGLYLFGPGQGLRLGDAGVRDEYTVEFSFRFEGGPNYQKLLDFKKGTQDGGLYTYQGHLTFYTLASGGAPHPGREHRIRIERDRETRVVRGYLDLRPIFAFIDLDDEAVFQDGAGMLFVDDVTTKGEQGPGALRWVNVRAPETPTKASP